MDAVRLTMVFAGPPEDDIDWADMSPAGSLKFLQRAWRLSGDVTSAPGTAAEGGDVALRKVTHRHGARRGRAGRVAPVQRDGRPDHGAGERDPQGDRLRCRAGRPGRARGRRGGRRSCCRLVAPYTAEEMWERLGHEPTVARAGWPVVDEALLVEDSVTASSRCRARCAPGWRCRPDISEADLEARRWPTRRCSGRWTGSRCAR